MIATTEKIHSARERIGVLKERQVDEMIIIPSFDGSKRCASDRRRHALRLADQFPPRTLSRASPPKISTPRVEARSI